MHGTPALSTGTVTLRNARVPSAARGKIGSGDVETLDIDIVDGRIAGRSSSRFGLGHRPEP